MGLQAARREPTRKAASTLNVGDLLGLHAGDNPHQWYFPARRLRGDRAIVADYDRLLTRLQAPTSRSAERVFQTRDLARYDALRREIRARYAGTPVGYSESIFQGLGEDLGLKLLTPYSFAKAIAEGTDVTAQDKRTVDSQAADHAIEVWVFNSQNVTPDVQRVNELGTRRPHPDRDRHRDALPGKRQLRAVAGRRARRLQFALHEATGR